MKTKPKLKDPAEKVGYWVNHDDVMFLVGQAEPGDEKNVPLGVYMDVCRAGTLAFRSKAPSLKIERYATRPNDLRLWFEYSPDEVKREFGFDDAQVAEAMQELMVVGIIWSSKPDQRNRYRVLIPNFRPAEIGEAAERRVAP